MEIDNKENSDQEQLSKTLTLAFAGPRELSYMTASVQGIGKRKNQEDSLAVVNAAGILIASGALLLRVFRSH